MTIGRFLPPDAKVHHAQAGIGSNSMIKSRSATASRLFRRFLKNEFVGDETYGRYHKRHRPGRPLPSGITSTRAQTTVQPFDVPPSISK